MRRSLGARATPHACLRFGPASSIDSRGRKRGISTFSPDTNGVGYGRTMTIDRTHAVAAKRLTLGRERYNLLAGRSANEPRTLVPIRERPVAASRGVCRRRIVGRVEHTACELFDRARRSTALLSDKLACQVAHVLSVDWIEQQLSHDGRQFRRIVHDTSRVTRQQRIGDVLKVPRVRPEQHRRAIACWFEHVLSAATCQAATHKRDVGESPTRTQFTERIEQEHVRCGWRERLFGDCDLTPSDEWPAALSDEFGHGLEPFLVSRDQDQSQRREFVT